MRGTRKGGVGPGMFVEVTKDDRCEVLASSLRELKGECLGEGGSLLFVEGWVGKPIYGDYPESWAGGGAEGGCNQAARWVAEGLNKGDASVPDKSGASGFLVGRVEGPEG